MASLIAKKKGHQLYYYVVESARVDGQPRIVHQSYLGSAEKVAALVRDRTAPIPLAATMRDFGLPGALWLVRIPAMPITHSDLMAITIPSDADHRRSEATLGCSYHAEVIGIRQAFCC